MPEFHKKVAGRLKCANCNCRGIGQSNMTTGPSDRPWAGDAHDFGNVLLFPAFWEQFSGAEVAGCSTALLLMVLTVTQFKQSFIYQ